MIGIIRAFHSMAIAGTGGFAVVAGGISEALIATALGLAVGIVALVFYNYFQARVERIDGALRIGSARVLEARGAARRDRWRSVRRTGAATSWPRSTSRRSPTSSSCSSSSS